ncbi:DEAD/DEAH box helicase [Rhodococcus sp. YH1]|uniref:DEAD/DEAH box helicase n=1 Tax=Rhodococcus sp. YH1 TaxID=89066 RepID=UPI0013870D9E
MSVSQPRLLGDSEALAMEFHTPESLADEGFVFHSMQQRVYQRLMDGESLILSAPTSFGKSVIIDALIAAERWSNLVLIVPTLALIDETRRRLSRFRSTYRIITHPAEKIGDRNIFIMTQERFLEVDDLPTIDFFMIDEFYKLGSGQKRDGRRDLLNVAWNRLKATGAQYYLLGPNIDALDSRLPEELHAQLLRTDFQTVAVDIDDRSSVENQRADLASFLENEAEGSSLVFTGSPQKAENLGVYLAQNAKSSARGLAGEVAEWIAENYDPDWDIVTALRGAVAVHTGPLPRGLQRIMVRLFNEARVPTLICTSTLIEGVNTSARNVVIFEKKIDNQLIDFFTFSNIRGRAGRMFRHYVGNVITYMPPPEAGSTTVDIPIESQSASASEATLVQISDDMLGASARERMEAILNQTALSLKTIRKNRGLDPSRQISLAERLLGSDDSELELLSWSGAPTNSQARAVLQMAFEELLEPSQRRGINFEMLWGQLQAVRIYGDNFSELVDRQQRFARKGQTRSDVISAVLRFQRNWMGFVIPSMLRGFSAIQSEVLHVRGVSPGNYEYFLREIESVFQAPGLADLEEYGLPLPLARKLLNLGLAGSDVSELLDSLIRLGFDPHVQSRLDTVEQWILEDVLDGLIGFDRRRT